MISHFFVALFIFGTGIHLFYIFLIAFIAFCHVSSFLQSYFDVVSRILANWWLKWLQAYDIVGWVIDGISTTGKRSTEDSCLPFLFWCEIAVKLLTYDSYQGIREFSNWVCFCFSLIYVSTVGVALWQYIFFALLKR